MGHLYEALIQKGIVTFKEDEKLETGKPISTELLKAIIISLRYGKKKICIGFKFQVG